MKKQMIKDLRVGGEVETQALIIEMTRAPFAAANRAGEYFLKLTLGDVSGRVKGVMWDPPRDGEETGQDDVVFIRGQVTDYHGPQVVVSEMRRLDPAKVNRAFFQPVSKRDLKEMAAELNTIINEEIKNSDLRALLKAFFSDPEFSRRFNHAPAARTVHHNAVGGLLEHTLEVAALCRDLARLYPEKLNLDLLLTGAVLHDMGKVEEYKQESISFDFTDRGKLVGHISIGKELLDQKLATLPHFPPALKLELEHMLLTHHGMREWGSPEVPKTLHSFALFHADLVSARMNQFLTVLDKHVPESGDWSEWDRFLERSIYTRLPEEQEK